MNAAALDGTLAALADPTRRGVVDLLKRRPRAAGELAATLEVTPPALSRHLRVLRKRGLIEEERDESDFRLRIYRLRPEPFSELQDWLRQVEGFWGEQLSAFRDHVEKKKKGGRR
jgi:DNA-binding transcriptional ArsR family regulator